MRHRTCSRTTALVVLSLVLSACGEKTTSAPSTAPGAPTTPSAPGSTPVALARRADTLQVDESIQLTAIVPPTPGSAAPTVWTSSDTNVAIVTQTGVVFAIKSGTTIVTVTSRGASDATTVTVKPSVREVTLDADTLAISVAESVQLPFRVTDTDGNDVDLNKHNVEWTSADPDVAPLTGNATVTGRTLGFSDVMLRVDGKYATTNVKVMPKPVATIVVTPASVALKVGDKLQLTSKYLDVYGQPVVGKPPVWSSSNPAAVNVTSDGLVVALGVGHSDVVARLDSKRATVAVDVAPYNAPPVAPAPVASAVVTLNATSIQAGQSTQANVTLKDASGNTLTGRTVVWTATDAGVASVSATGYVTSLKAGNTTITATSEGKSGSATLSVTAPPTPVASVASVTVSLTASPITVGGSTQAKAVLKDSTGTVLTGRTVAWVSSDATVASVDNAGLVSSLKAGSVTITGSSGGKAGTVVFTGNPPAAVITNVVLSTNASTIKMGQLTQINGVVKDKNGVTVTNVPITWSSSPTSVATITSTGMATGRGIGVATITAKADTVVRTIALTVLDSASAPTTPPPAPPTIPPGSTGPTNGTATAAELPRLSVNTTYPAMTRQVHVPAGANLQTVINSAQPGDELLLAPGASYVGNFTLPNKGSSSAWIVIRTDLPDATIGMPGTRMTPTRAASAKLAKIQTPNYMSVITSDIASSHYRFMGVEIGATSTASLINALIRFGDSNGALQNTAASIANNMIIDRTYLHGEPTLDLKRCLMMNSATTAVIDSWLSECHSNQGDSQAIVGWNGPGPYLIQNNHLEAGHEVVVFGGGSATIVNQSPSDITVRGNHIMRPLAWKGVWQVKNLLESKHAIRLLIEGNVFENNWVDAQAGFAFVLKSENQNNDNPWTTTSDVTIRYNRIRNTGNGINLAENPSGMPAIGAQRINITDNVLENINVSPYVGDGHSLQLLGGLKDIIWKHNTVTSANGGGAFTIVLGSLPAVQRLVVHSNVLVRGGYGVKGGGTTEGSISLNYYAPGYLLTNNVMVGSNAQGAYPANTWWTTSLAGVGFVNLSGGDYHLSSSSPYLGKGYDGQEVGADIDKVNAATAGAVVAP